VLKNAAKVGILSQNFVFLRLFKEIFR